MLYEQSRSGVAALVAAALLLGGLLWGTVPTAPLVSWLVLVMLLALVRLALVAGYERAHRIDVALRWRWYFVIVIALQGLAWGIGGAFFFAHADAVDQLVIALVIGGFAVIAIPYMAPVFVAYAVFTATMLGSFLTGLLVRADKSSIVLGSMIAVILPALLMIAHIYRRKLLEALQLGYENAALVSELRDYREQLEARVTHCGIARGEPLDGDVQLFSIARPAGTAPGHRRLRQHVAGGLRRTPRQQGPGHGRPPACGDAADGSADRRAAEPFTRIAR